IRKFLMTESGLYWRDAYSLVSRVERGLGNTATPALLQAAKRGTAIAQPGVNAAAHGLKLMSAATGVGIAATITESYMRDGVTKTNVAMTGLSLTGLGSADELVALGNISQDVRGVAEAGSEVDAVANEVNEGTQVASSRTQRLLAAPKMIRHHIFNKFRGTSAASQKYREFFAQHEIDVDEFTVEIPESMHQKFIHAAGRNWTTRWKLWIDANPNATTKEVYQFAG